MTPAETQRSPVKDIERAEQTVEREIYEEPNFKGTALRYLGDYFTNLGRGSGSGRERKNYLDLYKKAQKFREEAMAKGLKEDSAEFIELQNKYQQEAAALDWDYTPSEIDAGFKQVYGDKLMKPVEELIEQGAQQRISMDEEARLVGARIAPDKPAIEQASLGRAAYMSTKVSDTLLNELLPNMSAKEREDALSLNYRDAMQMVTLMAYDQYLSNVGGVANAENLQAFKTDWTARLRMAGFPGAAAQKFVDNTMAIYDGVVKTAGADVAAQAELSKNVKNAWENMSYMKMLSTPITYNSGTANKPQMVNTNVGAVLAGLGGTFSGEAGQVFLGLHPEVVTQIASSPNVQSFAALPDDFKDTIMSVQGNARIKRYFADGSIGSKNIDSLAQKGAQAYYEALKGMTREEMAQNAAYNTPANAYVGSHANVDETGFTDRDYQNQTVEFTQAAVAAGQGYNTFLQGEGAVLIDKAGQPHYMTLDNSWRLVDASEAGQLIEWLDNDAVDARNYVFPAARQAVATASDIIGWDKALEIWNLNQLQNSDKFKSLQYKGNEGYPAQPVSEVGAKEPPMSSGQSRKILQAFYDRDYTTSLDAERNVSGGPEAGLYGPEYRIQTPVANAKFSAYDNRTGALVFSTVSGKNVTSPVAGEVTEVSGNSSTNTNRISITTPEGSVWTITGTGLSKDRVNVGDQVKQKQVISRTGGKGKAAIGISIRTPEGTPDDPRKYYSTYGEA